MTAPLPPRMPAVSDFVRMGPERTAEWHRQSGVEAKVAAAIAEADESTSPRPFCTRCGSGLSNSEASAHGGLCCTCAPACPDIHDGVPAEVQGEPAVGVDLPNARNRVTGDKGPAGSEETGNASPAEFDLATSVRKVGGIPSPPFGEWADTLDRTGNEDNEPRTEAGKALIARLDPDGQGDFATLYRGVRAIEEEAAERSSYLCPHDLDLRLHARCYLCEPEVKEPEA